MARRNGDKGDCTTEEAGVDVYVDVGGGGSWPRGCMRNAPAGYESDDLDVLGGGLAYLCAMWNTCFKGRGG